MIVFFNNLLFVWKSFKMIKNKYEKFVKKFEITSFYWLIEIVYFIYYIYINVWWLTKDSPINHSLSLILNKSFRFTIQFERIEIDSWRISFDLIPVTLRVLMLSPYYGYVGVWRWQIQLSRKIWRHLAPPSTPYNGGWRKNIGSLARAKFSDRINTTVQAATEKRLQPII